MILARVFFLMLSLLLSVSFFLHAFPDQQQKALWLGGMVGVSAFFALLLLEGWWSRRSPKMLSTFLVGLGFGYLTGQTFSWMASAFLEIAQLSLPWLAHQGIVVGFFLTGVYLGVMTVFRLEGQWSLLLPCVRLEWRREDPRSVLIEASLLADERFFEFAKSGLLNGCVVLPKFILKDLYATLEHGEEEVRLQAKKGLETLRKLQDLPGFALHFDATDYPEIEDLLAKVVRLAKDKGMRLFVAEGTKAEVLAGGKVEIVTLQSLYRALKPTMQAGELLKIKIQRHGKESRQGVGYLDDGTMVVVNGGGDFVGEVVKTRILSVKQTSAGHLVFCNLLEDGAILDRDEELIKNMLIRS